jgi:hypothetical protein
MYKLTITPAIPPSFRDKLEALLRTEGCIIKGRGTEFAGSTRSTIEFANYRLSRVRGSLGSMISEAHESGGESNKEEV